MVEIRNRFTGEVICSGEKLAEAVRSNLKNLRGADLRDAYLRDAYLRGADLRGAYLSGADLSGAYLRDAYLRGADLRGADLSDADLSGADLSGAYLRGAYLRGADLRGLKLAYQSHDLLAEILHGAAGDDIAKLKVAGFILISRDKCWEDFAEFAKHDPLGDWALDELAKWVQPDDGAPEILRERVKVREG